MCYGIIFEYYKNVENVKNVEYKIASCYGASENCRVFCYAKLASAKFTHSRLANLE